MSKLLLVLAEKICGMFASVYMVYCWMHSADLRTVTGKYNNFAKRRYNIATRHFACCPTSMPTSLLQVDWQAQMGMDEMQHGGRRVAHWVVAGV